jgi:DNA-binding transcriptional MocR family regulator
MPYPYKVTAGVQAARHILMQRNRRQRGARSKLLSPPAAATAFGTSKSDVQRYLKVLENLGRPASSDRAAGRPRNLDEAEDRAFVRYVMWLERCGFPATQIQVEEAANSLRHSRTPSAGSVGEGGHARFITDHPKL